MVWCPCVCAGWGGKAGTGPLGSWLDPELLQLWVTSLWGLVKSGWLWGLPGAGQWPQGPLRAGSVGLSSACPGCRAPCPGPPWSPLSGLLPSPAPSRDEQGATVSCQLSVSVSTSIQGCVDPTL